MSNSRFVNEDHLSITLGYETMVILNKEKLGMTQQTNVINRSELRKQREETLVLRLRQKLKELAKRVPKSERLNKISREKKLSAIEKMMFADSQEQSDSDVPEHQFGFMPQSISDMLRIAGKVEKAADNITDLVSYFNTRMEELVESFKKTMKGFFWQIPLLCIAFCIADKLGVSLFFLGTLCPMLVTYLSDFWKSSYEAPHHQGGEDFLSMMTTLILTCVMPVNASSSVMCETILRRVGNFSKSAEGFKALFTSLIEMAEKVINAIADYFNAEHVQFLDTTAKVLKTWMMKVDAFETICVYGEPTIQELREAVALQGEGISLKMVARTPSTTIALNKYLEKVGMLISVRRGALNAAGCYRQEPAFCLLGGGSGVGKTVLQRFIAVSSMILSGILGKEEGIEQMWAKGASKYWNSYMGQLCLIWDDIFQVKKPASTEESDFMFIIKGVANFMLPLEFADVESKGRFSFTSPLIIASTNVQDVKSAAADFVRCPDAVSRRISDGYWLEVKPEYCIPGTQRLDYDKWSKEFARAVSEKEHGVQAETLLPCAWFFHPHDFESVHQKGSNPLLIKDVINKLADTLRSRKTHHDESLSVSDDYFNALKGIESMSDMDQPRPEKFLSDLQMKAMHEPVHQAGTWSVTSCFTRADESSASSTDGSFAFSSDDDAETHPDLVHLMNRPAGLNENMTESIIQRMIAFGAQSETPMSSTSVDTTFRSKLWDVLSLGKTASSVPVTPKPIEYGLTSWLDEQETALAPVYEEIECHREFVRRFGTTIMDWLCELGNIIPEALKKTRDLCFSALSGTAQYTYDAYIAYRNGQGILPLDALRLSGLAVLLVGAISAILLVVVKVLTATCVFFYDCADAILTSFGYSLKAQEQSSNPERKRGAERTTFVRDATFQGGSGNHDLAVKKILSNCFTLTAEKDGNKTHIGTLQFFDGNLAAMPYHFWREMLARVDNDIDINFTNAEQNKYNFVLNMRIFLSFKTVSFKESGLDLIFIHMDRRGVKAMKNIKGLLFSEKQMNEFTRISQKVTLHAIQASNLEGEVMRLTINRMESPYLKFLSNMTVQGNDYVQTFQYAATSSAGDCGSPLLLTDGRYFGNSLYLGMHYAGTRSYVGSKGFSTAITSEIVESAAKALGCYTDNFVEDMASRGVNVTECTAEEQGGLTGEGNLVDGSIMLLGKVDKPVNSSGKSQLKMSPMGLDALFGECPKAPAVLGPIKKDGVTIFPMVKSMEPYKTPHEWRKVPQLELAAELLTAEFTEVTKDFPQIVLTCEEAAIGVPTMAVKAIPRDTSPGYPYRLEKSVGKRLWLGEGQDYDISGPKWLELKARVEDMERQILDNKRPAVLYVGFLKDELRTHKKVEDVKTRYVSSCPQDYTLLVKMYFGAYVGARLQQNVQVGFGPGMNPMVDWADMVAYLHKAGDNIFAGDFKGFDASQQPYIHQVILDHINAWYRLSDSWNEKDERVRNMLWLDLIHSRHLVGKGHEAKYIVQWNKSLPSGHPLTTIVNSLFTVIVIGTCYLHATGDINGLKTHLKTVPFGDDNLNAVHDSMIEFFDQIVLADGLKKTFGLQYTDDVKDGALAPFKPLEECTFLQRGIKKDSTAPGGWRAPLGEDSFLWSPYWYRSNKSGEADMFENVKMMQAELSQHSQEMWDMRMGQLTPWLKEHGWLSRLPFQSREAALQWREAHTDVWI